MTLPPDRPERSDHPPRRLVVVSGLSGAGKTVALKQFEDLGYTCIDNLPLILIEALVGELLKPEADQRYQRVALGVDARESEADIRRFPSVLERLREGGVEVEVVFLTAADEVILRRYSETRRRHPLSDDRTSLREAIERERGLLAPIANMANLPLDTSRLNLHELREAIHARTPEAAAGRLALLFLSFGFKNGLPEGCDFVFDIRCLPNPHWQPDLRRLTGRDEPVARWLSAQAVVQRMERDLVRFLEHWLPEFRAQDRAYVTVGIGCTGGQHRSVYLVERLAQRFRGQFDEVLIKHKELPGLRVGAAAGVSA
ncbi:MAG TPA: RNase adapter RapZ [Nevskiaceae bacterium]|nr:RNase adapter RapZ [Nevskiaceae bacterium]